MPRLSKDERAALEKQLKDDDDAADDFEVEIGSGDSYARVPYSKGKSWLQQTFGIDLDAEPKPEKDEGGKGGQVRPFGGRRAAGQ